MFIFTGRQLVYASKSPVERLIFPSCQSLATLRQAKRIRLRTHMYACKSVCINHFTLYNHLMWTLLLHLIHKNVKEKTCSIFVSERWKNIQVYCELWYILEMSLLLRHQKSLLFKFKNTFPIFEEIYWIFFVPKWFANKLIEVTDI